MKKILLSLLACGIASASFAQSLADIQSPNLLPPPPEAAGLGKYGQIPVDKSTGIPSISIPLYEIKTPRFSLPISLSYHASGIKVDETAGWVGIGWSLNAGGVVTRSMVGLADDYAGYGYLNDAHSILTAQTLFNNFHADSGYMENAARNIEDSQPDNFFYNFVNQSGAFIFGSDVARTPVLIPFKPLKVTFTQGGGGSFSIIDESGNQYKFNDRETSTSSISYGMTGTSSWYLSQMISADKSDTVKFTYTTPYTFSDYAYSFTQNLGPRSGNGGLWPLVKSTSGISGQQIYLTSIQFKGGRVDFKTKTGRKDNGALALDSVIVSNYNFNSKIYTRLKSFKMLTDYFHSAPLNQYGFSADSASTYRLRLTGLTENDQNNSAVKSHQFAYNTTALPPVHNFGQDKWGYYNGHYTNQTLLEAQTISSYYSYAVNDMGVFTSTPVTYVIGSGQGADRSVSAVNAQAGILQQITYPTKGYTVFAYESHQSLIAPVSTVTVQSFAIGYLHPSNSTYFTPTQDILNSLSQNGSVDFHIHINSNAGTTYSNSGIYIELLQGSTVLYQYYASSSTTAQDFDIQPILTAGTTYQLLAVATGGTSSTDPTTLPQCYITTAYQVSGTPVATSTGGLRVKSIKNYDSNGSILSTETYKYGIGESGAGDFITNPNFMINTSTHIVAFDGPPYSSTETTYSNSSTYPLSSLNGSPMAYEQVTVYHGDTVQNIGKSIYQYTVTPDSLNVYTVPQILVNLNLTKVNGIQQYWHSSFAGSCTQGVKTIPRLWQNGDPVSESHYLNAGGGVYTLQQAKSTTYLNFFKPAGHATVIGYALEFQEYQRTQYVTSNLFNFYDYPISIGSRQPVQTITYNYATNGTPTTADTTRYYYDNLSHMFATRIRSYNGKGDSLLKKVMYPQDMVSAGLDPTGIYAAMVTANIISPVIQFTQSKDTTQLMQSVTTYNGSNPNANIEPYSVSLQTMRNAAETRLNYGNNYDGQGNLLSVSKPNGAPVSYTWGYKGAYPVAEIKNAPSKDIFFESFEDGNGNTGFNDAKTGHYSFLGLYSKTLSGLDNGAYLLTYWLKTGSVWGAVTTPVTVSGGSYTISLSGQVDDIRFYPAAAMMTTYTYDPLIGVTSVTDQKGEISYYEYDSFQRLQNIRDQYKNIIKSFCYNYAGQTTNCFINQPSYSSAARDSIFTRNCGTGYTGSAVHYILSAGAFTSNVSQADANTKAKNDVIANGQNYANLNGTCTQNTIGFTMTNTTGVAGIQVTFYATTNLYYTVPTSGSLTVQVPPGTYSSMSVGVFSGPTHTYTLGTRTPVTNSIAGFSNVVIATGSSDLTLTVH